MVAPTNEHTYSIEKRSNSRGRAIESGYEESNCSSLTTASLLTSLRKTRQLEEPVLERSPSPVENHPLEAVDFHSQFLHHLDANSVSPKQGLAKAVAERKGAASSGGEKTTQGEARHHKHVSREG